MGRRQRRVISELACGVCKTVIPIPRAITDTREARHVKHMYCPSCGEEQAFIEHTIVAPSVLRWTLMGIDSSVLLGRALILYHTASQGFLSRGETVKLLKDYDESLPEDKSWNLADTLEYLETSGYVTHFTTDNKR